MSTQRVDPILNPTTLGTIHINRSGRYSDFVEDVRTTHRTLVKIIATFQTRPKMSTGDKDSVAPLLKADHTKDISKFFADFRNTLCGWFGRQWFDILRVFIFGVRRIFREQA